ncbi:opacity family porin [Conservatibacter flavescens]|uniref:Porin n=1 Tax=Conservatibacter flavescens TaxID=28161 RepID=A0A2M8RZT6_9PAST|nr:opacity family porin [Conservatibacter flavescens]PJG84378.1 porin [Conservatibacter flavescens]
MKKTLFTIAFGALAMASTASANWYVQGDLGYSKAEVDANAKIKDSGFEPRVSVGYKLQDFRLAVDYTHYQDVKDSYQNGSVVGNAKTTVRGVGLSAIYDIPVQSDLKPYVGGRLAVNQLKLSDRYVHDRTYGEADYKETSVGVGALVGATYPLTPNVKLNVGAEYNRLGKVDDASVNNYGVKVGLRYDF